MGIQKFIASHYPQSRTVSNVQELLRHRKADQICIIGNGPTAFSFADRIHDYDISGTSALTLQEKSINYYFSEPFFLLEHAGASLSSPRDIAIYAMHAVMMHEAIGCINEESCSVIIPNPNIPGNDHGYLEVPRHPSIDIPPWYFINEADDKSIADGLRRYFKGRHYKSHILNFRGSVIRQLSLAFSLGYEHIYLDGIDPSSLGYWYTNQSTSAHRFRPAILNRCEQLFKSYDTALNSGDNLVSTVGSWNADISLTYYEFTRSILIALRFFCLSCPRQKAYFLVKDPKVRSYCSELAMDRVENLVIVN